ncbi:uncharacterized protein LOC123318668 [Coccinella septempunctata]|uniref:uncharacterized protein LOC123318668 n=1 Tax=Coccinella septempunctata TaxID=41139 RepID=UPI001D077F3A|nr:uncharacterized protein LOC123318668 [Coccinella septempunctata]
MSFSILHLWNALLGQMFTFNISFFTCLQIRQDVEEAGPSDAPLELPSEDNIEDVSVQENIQNSQGVQTDITNQDFISMKVELSDLRQQLKQMRELTICVEVLEGNDIKTLYYSGLPTYMEFDKVSNLVVPYIKTNLNTVLSPSNQVLLTLMKLRLNLYFKDIAHRFGISPTTAANHFKTILAILCLRLKNFVFWPERETLLRTMPSYFKEAFQENTTVIIDCFEIKTERPNDMLAAAQTWSHYKHSRTVKYLIGITPQGSICFITEGWGGRASDKNHK